MNARAAAALGLAAVLAASCSSPAEGPADAGSAAAPARPAPSPSGHAPEELARLGEEAGIHNLAEPAPGLFRGAQPEGDAAFALLARLGVRTLLSVDGAKPDAEAAARHGMRYVHVPVEYATITREEQVKIARVARDLPGGLFVHCHHGKHRGPAAGAIAWMARDGVPPGQCLADMKAAGTDPRYRGLYGDVEAFRPVTAEELAGVRDEDLPPAARVPDLVEAMVALDATFTRMKTLQKAGWRTPASMPDVNPPHEARILAERFAEFGRLEAVKGKPDDFRGWVAGSEKDAWDLEKGLRAGDAAAAAAALDRVGAACGACHDVYRNRK